MMTDEGHAEQEEDEGWAGMDTDANTSIVVAA